jgi:hypothetical protein
VGVNEARQIFPGLPRPDGDRETLGELGGQLATLEEFREVEMRPGRRRRASEAYEMDSLTGYARRFDLARRDW